VGFSANLNSIVTAALVAVHEAHACDRQYITSAAWYHTLQTHGILTELWDTILPRSQTTDQGPSNWHLEVLVRAHHDTIHTSCAPVADHTEEINTSSVHGSTHRAWCKSRHFLTALLLNGWLSQEKKHSQTRSLHNDLPLRQAAVIAVHKLAHCTPYALLTMCGTPSAAQSLATLMTSSGALVQALSIKQEVTQVKAWNGT
jgi:hypothetical protein